MPRRYPDKAKRRKHQSRERERDFSRADLPAGRQLSPGLISRQLSLPSNGQIKDC
jgi:hypothetical protein